MFKRIVNSDGFKIYFWPLAVCYLFALVMMFLFFPLEPESLKETVFVYILGLATMSCFWTLPFRYRKVKNKSVGKRAMILLIIITAVFLLSAIVRTFTFL